MNNEIWKPVVGYEDYYLVSSFGRVKNIARGIRRQQGRVFTGSTNKLGYRNVFLCAEGRPKKQFKIHRLVAIAFLPNPENKREVNHIDFNPSNNHISNLEWVTPKENVQHSIRAGRSYNRFGTKNGRAVITELQAINIRHCKGSITADQLSELYGVGRNIITKIWSGRRWSHLWEGVSNA